MSKLCGKITTLLTTCLVVAGLARILLHEVREGNSPAHHAGSCDICLAAHSLQPNIDAPPPVLAVVATIAFLIGPFVAAESFVPEGIFFIRSALDPPSRA